MSRQGGLGRGLGSLIPSDVTTDSSTTYQLIAVSSIRPNNLQPREHFDEETLDSLTSSVRELGILQPLLVRKSDDGYELIAGERRWRAAKRAGLQEVPVILREADDMSSLEQALVENLHRQDLNVLEEAAAYQQLIDDFSMTQQQVAKRVGKSRSAVANTLRLLGLPTSIQRLIAERALSPGHARALLSVEGEPEREALAKRIVREDLTVRDIERLLRPEVEDSTTSKKKSNVRSIKNMRPPALLELEGLLSERLSTRVAVTKGAKRGRIVIDYADLDDLERIYRIIAD